MADNGMSKKLCITLIGIQAIITMSADDDEKFKYALLVVAVIVFYKTIQFLIDRKKYGKDRTRTEDGSTNV